MRITASSFTDPPRISRTNCPKNEARFETALKPLHKVPPQCFSAHVVQPRGASNAVSNQHFPRAAKNLNQTVSFGNGSEPHGISSQARISQSPVLNENGFSELQRELLSSAQFVKRPPEPVFSYTHLERGFIVK
ncbi:hypothetical protein MRB53_023486 [Persea americana]|uniref:Uncharacterized protein n=1 Tax=Persea americana TaxID=3435 RepID=A0ACC2LAR6_PERAE|nr:hypothetical protein MRB53_023486 [Persea americana]